MATTQKKAIQAHLGYYKEITSLQAIKEYGITRLASVICKLRDEGYKIETKLIFVKNRFGGKSRVANYIFKGKVKVKK